MDAVRYLPRVSVTCDESMSTLIQNRGLCWNVNGLSNGIATPSCQGTPREDRSWWLASVHPWAVSPQRSLAAAHLAYQVLGYEQTIGVGLLG